MSLGLGGGARGISKVKKNIVALSNKLDLMSKAIVQADYASTVAYLNPLSATELILGQDIYILTVDTPDLWISEVHANSVPYTYVDDDTLLSDINTGNGKLQIGYYSISIAESVGVGVFELLSNKSSNVDTDKTSTTKYANVKAIYDWATGKFIALSKLVTSWTATTLDANVPSEKLVKDSLNLKADITPANGSTSALRALFVARSWNRAANYGAERYELTYNATSGYYEMYGITNLTESDVLEIHNASLPLASQPSTNGTTIMEGVFAYRKARTHFPLVYFGNYYQTSFRYFAQNNVKFEKFIFEGFFGSLAVGNALNMFNGCILLNEVRTLDLQHITNAGFVGNIFLGCSSLVTCYVKNIKVSLSFGSSPLLSLASLQYLVTNRANGTSRITITVHATVWAKLDDAVNYPAWNALLVDAVANQFIDFANA